MRFVRAAFALSVLSLLLAAGAAAQPPGLGLPRDAAAVAGPTSSGVRLYVWDERGDLCGSATRPRARSRGSACGGGWPRSLREPMISAVGNRFVWGFVAPEVASVEMVSERGRHVATATTAGARYRGKHAGQGRTQGRGPLRLGDSTELAEV